MDSGNVCEEKTDDIETQNLDELEKAMADVNKTTPEIDEAMEVDSAEVADVSSVSDQTELIQEQQEKLKDDVGVSEKQGPSLEGIENAEPGNSETIGKSDIEGETTNVEEQIAETCEKELADESNIEDSFMSAQENLSVLENESTMEIEKTPQVETSKADEELLGERDEDNLEENVESDTRARELLGDDDNDEDGVISDQVKDVDSALLDEPSNGVANDEGNISSAGVDPDVDMMDALDEEKANTDVSLADKQIEDLEPNLADDHPIEDQETDDKDIPTESEAPEPDTADIADDLCAGRTMDSAEKLTEDHQSPITEDETVSNLADDEDKSTPVANETPEETSIPSVEDVDEASAPTESQFPEADATEERHKDNEAADMYSAEKSTEEPHSSEADETPAAISEIAAETSSNLEANVEQTDSIEEDLEKPEKQVDHSQDESSAALQDADPAEEKTEDPKAGETPEKSQESEETEIPVVERGSDIIEPMDTEIAKEKADEAATDEIATDDGEKQKAEETKDKDADGKEIEADDTETVDDGTKADETEKTDTLKDDNKSIDDTIAKENETKAGEDTDMTAVDDAEKNDKSGDTDNVDMETSAFKDTSKDINNVDMETSPDKSKETDKETNDEEIKDKNAMESIDETNKASDKADEETNPDESKENGTDEVQSKVDHDDKKDSQEKKDDVEEVKVEAKEEKCESPIDVDELDLKGDHKVVRQESKSPETVGKDKVKTDKDDKKSSKQKQTCIVCRRVGKCKYNIVRNGDIKHLCDDVCFKRFRTNPTTFLVKEKETSDPGNCGHCKAGLVKGKSEKVDGINFCSTSCAKLHKDAKAKSSSGDDDIEIVGTSTAPVAPVKQSARQSAQRATNHKCAVCNQIKATKHEVNFGKELHRLCSDSCFAAFRYANKLNMSSCDSCSKVIRSENPANTIKFDGQTRKFCNVVCMNTFKSKKQKVVACCWCQTKKSNFDMVEKVDGNKVQLFCSLNCLSLYRVNLQATSNQKVTCDHCTKFLPAQYHLTMSDASVRNFCSYNCVMGFQAQFQQPQAGGAVGKGAAGRGTPVAGAVPQNQATGRGRGRPSRKAANKNVGAAASNNIPMISSVHSLAEGVGTRRKSASPQTVTISSGSEGRSSAPPAAGIATQVDAAAAITKNSAAAQHQTPPPPAPRPLPPPPPEPKVSVSTQIIVQPPQPKTMRNKSLLCKPIVQTKATSCKPHAITEGTQTEEDFVAKPTLIPIPVPIYVPVPMAMYNIPVPYPVPLPLPIPVPCFVPTTRKSADGIMKQIKKIRDTVPDDPFEAELLMMAEAVAGNKGDSSSSDEDNGDDFANDDSSAAPSQPAGAAAAVPSGGGQQDVYGEDMLQMALRMAEMPQEPAMDLESQLQATPVNPSAPLPQPYSTIENPTAMMPEVSPARGRGRAKRRSSARTPKPKKPKIEEVQEQIKSEPINVAPQEPPADANMVLKFTYGVNAWKHWVIGKNETLQKNYTGKSSNLRLYKSDVLACTPDELNFALCQFVKEVRKPNGEEYAPDSIYYLTLGIQEYLFENGRIDNIFTDIYYERFTECLNEVLSHYEVRLNQQGLIVCRIEEEHLWESKQLGAHSPHVLLNTLVYFNTKFFMLRSVEEHLRLSFSHIMKHWKKTGSQHAKNPGRSVYLRYYAPAQSTDGNRGKRREDQPVFEQAENLDNPLRCPVKLYEFYLSKCPESIKNRNDVFYLVPERSCVPDSPVWYSTSNLGADHMSKMLNRLRVVKEIQEAQLHMQPYQGPY